MHLVLHHTANLKKLQALPAASHWVNNKLVWIYGDIILYTRHYGFLDKVSSEARRACVLTKNGDLICYMKERQGFVLDLHASTEFIVTTGEERLKKRDPPINRCKMKIRFKFGTVNISLYGEDIEKWRNGVYTVLDGKAHAITETVVTPAVEKEEEPLFRENELDEEWEKEEEGEINQGDVSSFVEHDNSRGLDQSIVSQTEQPTEQSMESDTASQTTPFYDLLSDSPTPPNQEPEKEEEEPAPTTTIQPSYPPHRSANIALIHPHPPRHIPSFIPPPTEAPPSKPSRLSPSMMCVVGFFERVNQDQTDWALRSATMPRKLACREVNGPATLPRPATSRTQSTSRVSLHNMNGPATLPRLATSRTQSTSHVSDMSFKESDV